MPRPELLSNEHVQEQLALHPLWRLSADGIQPKHIVRELHAKDWMAALAIVNAIAIVADTMDHHPDLFLYGWNKVRVTVSTHDQGGLTPLDFALADKIDALPFSSEAKAG